MVDRELIEKAWELERALLVEDIDRLWEALRAVVVGTERSYRTAGVQEEAESALLEARYALEEWDQGRRRVLRALERRDAGTGLDAG